MFTNLQNANIKVTSWLLEEGRMYVFSKEGMRNEIHFINGNISRSDLQVAVSGWVRKVMGTDSDKKILWKVDPKGRVFA